MTACNVGTLQLCVCGEVPLVCGKAQPIAFRVGVRGYVVEGEVILGAFL